MKIIALENARAVRSLPDLSGQTVEIEEKIDGSFFEFWKKEDGTLGCASKGQKLSPDAGVPDLFRPSVIAAEAALSEMATGWIYRGEAMKDRRHNTLVYERVARGNIVMFDLISGGTYCTNKFVSTVARDFKLEPVPLLGTIVLSEGTIDDHLKELQKIGEALIATQQSCLGGPIEGVVFKLKSLEWVSPYHPYPHPVYFKLVSPKFKEAHKDNPDYMPRATALENLIESLTTEARWTKAVQHMAEEGRLTNTLQDIGPLMGEISRDVFAEEEGHIKDVLYKAAKKDIGRGVTRGAVEWYKARLLESS